MYNYPEISSFVLLHFHQPMNNYLLYALIVAYLLHTMHMQSYSALHLPYTQRAKKQPALAVILRLEYHGSFIRLRRVLLLTQ